MASRWKIVATIGVLTVGLLLVQGNVTDAQQGGLDVNNVAVVDMTRVFNDCRQTQALNEYLETQAKDFRVKHDGMKDKLDQKQAELEAFAPGSKEYTDRFKQWMKMQVDLNTEIRLQQRATLRDRTHWTRTTYQQIVDAVETIAKQKGLLLVLYRDQMDLGTDDLQELERRLRGRKVIYAAGGLDITGEVVSTLDSAFEAGGGMKIPGTNP